MAKVHTECGAELLKTWNMPEAFVNVVASHHVAVGEDDDALLAAIRLADLACNKLGIGLREASDSYLAATAEAGTLRLTEIAAAEL
jgi:HD-like signal output (HDOD) protein